MIKRITKRLKILWLGVTKLFIRPTRLKTVWVDELPDRPDSKSVYVVGEGKYLWFVAMICPCGCGAMMQMNLMKGKGPRWYVTEHKDGSISLHPSVWRKKDCQSHFHLLQGKVQWCTSYTERNSSMTGVKPTLYI